MSRGVFKRWALIALAAVLAAGQVSASESGKKPKKKGKTENPENSVTETEVTVNPDGSRTIKTVTTTIVTELPEAEAAPENPADYSNDNGKLGHFTWGADLGSAVDLLSNNMTNIDITGYFGYKGSWVRFAGVGAGACTMLNNSSRCFPFYGMLRTSFSRHNRLCFLDVRAGVSFNNIMSQKTQTDFYGSIGVGITLASSLKFSSHIILSYNFMPLKTGREIVVVPPDEDRPAVYNDDAGGSGTATPPDLEIRYVPQQDMHFAAIRIGCSF